MTTVMPTLVIPKSSSANRVGRCTQPCDSGYPGLPPAWRATPSQVSLSEYGIGALPYVLEVWSLSLLRIVKIPVGVLWPGFPVETFATPISTPLR